MIAVFIFSALSVAVPTMAVTLPERNSLEDLEGIDGTPMLETRVVEGAQPDTGNPWDVIVSDILTDEDYVQTFECVLEGTHGNIWIGLNDTDWNGYQDYYDDKGTPEFDDDEWHFMYPWTWSGIPEYGIPAGYHDIIYGRNLTYILDQFDTNIHDTCTTFFGPYADRPGPESDYKIQTLIFNIRDYLFWIPLEAPFFIQGYYWYYASWLNNANIIHIDTWQWVKRLGPNPPVPNPLPYDYEGTVAHEFQHLIHRDNDYNEMAWVNEGCSDLAVYACGYGFPAGHISEYLIWWWDTSLVIWEGTLADYGAAFLWTFYVYEHYGGQQLIWDIVHEQANGIEGYNKVLKRHHVKKTFDDIFQDWAIANYLDDTTFADGIYGYYDLDIPSADTEWYSLPLMIYLWNAWYPWFDIYVDAYPNAGYNYPYGSSLPYVVNYVEFYDHDPALRMYFDGDDYSGIPAHSGMYHWYSDGVSYSWFRLGQTVDLTALTTATLKFWSYYAIEENWDYGYVEVHDLTTDEWYTLPGLTTVSTIPHPHDNPNCPDAFEPTTYLAAERWNAFTGSGYGWYQEVMDLSPFAGHIIELYFTYWTDPYTLDIGWYIDDIEIPEIGFFDDVESGPGDWTYTGWSIAESVLLYNDFEVNFIQGKVVEQMQAKESPYKIIHMELADDTEDGWQLIQSLVAGKMKTLEPTVMVVANQPGYEHTFETFYWFYANIDV